MAGGIALTDLTCTTSTTNTQLAYAQINLNYGTSTAYAGNVCSVTPGSATAGITGQGFFIASASGNFINAAGTAVSTGFGDTTKSYYAGVRSIWTGGTSSGTEGALATALTIICYDATYHALYCSWLSTLVNAEATVNIPAAAVDFATTPTDATTACRFTVKPSSTSTVTLTATGSPVIGCASQTGSTVWGSYSFRAAGSLTISHTTQINCVQIA